MSSRPPHRGGDAGDAVVASDIDTHYRALSVGNSRSLPFPSSSTAEQAHHKRRRHKPTSSSSNRKLLPSSASSSASSTTSSSSSSLWRTAISYLGRHRLDCAFTLHAHSVDGLPASFDGAPISVQFRRTPTSATARPVLAAHGAAAFGEALTLRSPVYFSRAARAAVKYEPRAFTVSVFASALDHGKHEVDLTRLLPLSIHDLADGGGSPGFEKWITSFRLSGPARGARLHVTFSCALIGKHHKGTEVAGGSMVARPVPALDCEDQGSPEAKHCTSVVEVKKGDLVHPEDDHDIAEFSIVHQGVESATDDPGRFKHVGRSNAADQAVQVAFEELFCNEYEAGELKTDEDAIDVAVQWEILPDKGQDEIAKSASSSVPTTTTTEAEGRLVVDKELEDLESMLSNLSFLGQEEFDSGTSEPDGPYSFASKDVRFRNMDASSDYVAREHSTFGQPSDADPESPRERLWKQFEKEALASGNNILGLDLYGDVEEPVCDDVVDLSAIIHEAELELQNASQPVDTKFQAIAGR